MKEGASGAGRGPAFIIASVCVAMAGIVVLSVSFVSLQWSSAMKLAEHALLYDATLAAQQLDSALAIADLALEGAKGDFGLARPAGSERHALTKAAFRMEGIQNAYLLDEEGGILGSAFSRVDPSLAVDEEVLDRLSAGEDSVCRILDAPAEGGTALVLLKVLRREHPSRYCAVVLLPTGSQGRIAVHFPHSEWTFGLSDDAGGTLSWGRAGIPAGDPSGTISASRTLSGWPVILRFQAEKSSLSKDWLSQSLSLAGIVAAFVVLILFLLVYGASLSRQAGRVDELTRLTERLNEEVTKYQLAERGREASEERYRFSLEISGQIGWSTPPDGLVEDLPLWRQYSGQSVEEVQGWKWLDAIHPDDRASAFKAWSAAVAQKSRYETEYRIRRADGVYRHFMVRGIPLFDAKGSCREWVGTCFDITERKLDEEILGESEERFRRLFAEHAAAKLVIDPDSGTITDANAAAADFYGWSIEELRRMRIQEINTLPQDNVTLALGKAAASTQTKFEFRHRLADGSIRDVEVLSNRIEIRGKGHLFSIIHDITERRSAELALLASLDEKTTLLKEVHHRVKNNLQIVASLLSLQARRIGDSEAVGALRNIEGRILSMSLLHESLYRSDNFANIDFSAYAEGLCAQLFRSFGDSSGGVRLERRVESVELSLEQALPCGLIIHELVSNALKHAFPGERKGKILVDLRLTAGGWADLRVEDDGVGLPAGHDSIATSTLGLRLVSKLARQLGGRSETKTRGTEGTTILVSFPIDTQARAGSFE